ncbi:hypothetical protein SLA2020_299870 [Shorea laevis]
MSFPTNQFFPFYSETNIPYLWILLMFFLASEGSRRLEAWKATGKLPPGPLQLPLIGNLYQLAAAGSLPHHSLRNLANKYGPLMHLLLGEVPTIVASSPEITAEILKTHDTIFAYRPTFIVPMIISYECKDIACAPYGSYWRQLRKVCTVELLSANRVQSFRSIRDEEVSDFIKTIYFNEGQQVNLSEKINSLTYSITSRATFGKKTKDQSAFIKVITDINSLVSGFCLADLYPSIKVHHLLSGLRMRCKRIHSELDRILGNILNDHKETRAARAGDAKEGLLDVLLRLQENGEFPLTDSNIKAVIMDIFSAGSDTSSITVGWAMSEMMKNPAIMREAQAEVRRVFKGKGDADESGLQELKYLKLVVKETLRLHPPAPLLLPRECSESCEINGYKIAAKTRVIVNAWALGRDPGYWTEAEEFKPERFLNSPLDYSGRNFEYIPFGAGRRICPGILFAQPNIELPLAKLLFQFDWKLPNGMKPEDLDMSEDFGLALRRKRDLVLVPTSYQTLPAAQ